jgi:uncharacterized delta-60 repeat protein
MRVFHSCALTLLGVGFVIALSCKSNTITTQDNMLTCSPVNPCVDGTVCVFDVCRAPCADGGTCQDPALVCLSGGCVPPLTDGGSPPPDAGGTSFATKPAAVRVVRGGTAGVEVDLVGSTPASPVDVTLTFSPNGVTAGVSSTTATIAGGSAQLVVTASASGPTGVGQATVHTVNGGVPDLVVPVIVAGPSTALDTSLNQGGVVNFTPPGGDSTAKARALCIQSDGAIVVAGDLGTTSPGWAVARFSTNGVLDTSFAAQLADAGNGALLPAGGNVVDVACDPSTGRIFVAGIVNVNTVVAGPLPTAAVLALNADGTRDEAFATNGLWYYVPRFGLMAPGYVATAAALDGKGGVYVATTQGTIFRVDATGNLGIGIYAGGSADAVTTDPAGDVYFAGVITDDAGNAQSVALGRVDPTGKSRGAPAPIPLGSTRGFTVNDALVDDGGTFVVGAAAASGNIVTGGFPMLSGLTADGGLLYDGGVEVGQGAGVVRTNGYYRGTFDPNGKFVVVGNGQYNIGYAKVGYVHRLTPGAGFDPTWNPDASTPGVYVMWGPTTYTDVAVDSLARIVLVGNAQGWSITRLWP